MEKPYRFLKNLQKMGNSMGVLIPKVWFEYAENRFAEQVQVEVYSDKIVLIPIKKKQDMIRALIEKTRGDLVVSSCEHRIHEKTHEFHGLLDRVNGEGNHRKKKVQSDDEEDIDIDKVW